MSRQYPFLLVDAFTKVALGGNPCAVILQADDLSPEEMLKIAKEMNQSETAFLMKSKIADAKARYFTPEREIPLAGHPTIASIHALLQKKIIEVKADSKPILLELNDGPIEVYVNAEENFWKIKMVQRKPQFFEIHDPKIVLPLFSLAQDDLYPDSVIQTVSTGTRQLMVFVRGKSSLQKVKMNVDAYKEYRKQMNFFSPHIFCLEGVTFEGQTFARHPGVPPDTQEDAFTGSSTGGMAAYLWKYGWLKEPVFKAEQGHWMGRPGMAFVEINGLRDNIQSVAVAGTAVTTVDGILTI